MEDWYLLTGGIDSNVAHQFITWVQEHRCRGMRKLTFFISSVGGDIDSSLRVYDFLKSSGLEITTVGFGQIDSAANILFLSGKKRLATEGCRFFLHEGTYNFGNPKSALHVHDETVRLFKNMYTQVCQIISTETGQSVSNIKSKLLKGILLDTTEAKKLGLVTEICKEIPLQSINI